MKRRQWISEEKVAIVLEGLQQNRSISEVCREHQISQALYYQWRDAFLEGAKTGLRPKRQTESAMWEKKIAEYERLVGELTMQIKVDQQESLSWRFWIQWTSYTLNRKKE